jgi:hypothetical protein
MYYHVFSKRTIIDKKGNDKNITEQFLVKDVEYFADAEVKVLEKMEYENDVCAIKRSPISEFINRLGEGEDKRIYVATIESVGEDAKGGEKTSRSVVGLFASDFKEATNIVDKYLHLVENSNWLVEVKRTPILEVI